MRNNTASVTTPNRSRVIMRGPDGSRVRLSDLPLVVFRLSCGHMGREYAIALGDHIFCEECGTTNRVRKIIAE